jgi:hypothetical protein
MKNVPWLLAVVCLCAASTVAAAEAPPLQFITEYLRDFGAIEHIRLAQEQELQAPQQDMLATCVKNGNRYRSEISGQVARLRSMSAPPSWQDLSGRLVGLYNRKLGLYTEVIKACTALAAGTNAQASSLEVMAAISQYNARVDAIDKSLFETSTQAFATLLSAAPDRRGKLTRLSITTAEKQSLLRQIQLEFGAELDEDQQTYLVSAATLIRDAVRSHAAADEK